MGTGITDIEINPDWFYHRVSGDNIDKFILSGSIKAKRYLKGETIKERGSSSNGSYYISLAKYKKDLEKSYHSSYRHFIRGQYAFVIEGVTAIETELINGDFTFYRKLAKLPVKKRYSVWEDEYQVKKEISLDKVVGIKIPSRNPIYSWFFPNYLDSNRGIDFFLEKMELVGGDFPFIDLEEKKMIEKGKIKEYIKGVI